MPTIEFDGQPHRFSLEAIVGGKNLRLELGELLVALAPESGSFRLLGADAVALTNESWQRFAIERQAQLDEYNTRRRRASAERALLLDF